MERWFSHIRLCLPFSTLPVVLVRGFSSFNIPPFHLQPAWGEGKEENVQQEYLVQQTESDNGLSYYWNKQNGIVLLNDRGDSWTWGSREWEQRHGEMARERDAVEGREEGEETPRGEKTNVNEVHNNSGMDKGIKSHWEIDNSANTLEMTFITWGWFVWACVWVCASQRKGKIIVTQMEAHKNYQSLFVTYMW